MPLFQIPHSVTLATTYLRYRPAIGLIGVHMDQQLDRSYPCALDAQQHSPYPSSSSFVRCRVAIATYLTANANPLVSRICYYALLKRTDMVSPFPCSECIPVFDSVCSAAIAILRTLHGLRRSLEPWTGSFGQRRCAPGRFFFEYPVTSRIRSWS